MFRYFPDNYNWSLAVALAIGMGGELTEIDDACRPLRPLALAASDDESQRSWFDAWTAVAERAAALATVDADRGRTRSAGRKHLRAAAYHLMAERMMTNHSPLKARSYRSALTCFERGVEGRGHRVEFVDVPFEDGTSLPCLLIPARSGAEETAPCLIMFNGFDVTKEVLYLMGVDEIATRGVSVLLCDQPGSGGALRLAGLPTRPDMETAATACVDHLSTRNDVDPERIAIAGISMGGYFAPRAAAYEPRLAACIAWGAFHDLLDVAANLQNTGAHSAPPFQIPWVFGVEDPRELADYARQFTLDGVAEKITCPLLVLHGANDQQVPVEQAHRTLDQADNAPSRDLVVFADSDWGDQHCQVDNPTLAIDLMADWLQEVLTP